MNYLNHFMNRGILLFLSLLNTSILSAQSITPFTINIAGFTSTQNGYALTVSTVMYAHNMSDI